MTEETSNADEVVETPDAGSVKSGDNGQLDEASNKKEKKKKVVENVEKRERSSRGAKTKAALQISLSSMKDYDSTEASLTNGVSVSSSRGRPKKVKQDEIMSSSPLKFKAGPRCTKTPLKPGPASKRRRNFQYEELFLDQISLDEMPMTSTYDKKLAKCNKDKEKLKACVPCLDLKKARNPCVKAAYELALEYYQTVGQFKGINNLVTVTYQKPKVTQTFSHRPDPTRLIMNDTKNPAIPRQLITNPPPASTSTTSTASSSNLDILKPPPITNYMSVKIETLMNCLEKMYFNHLPLNAFTSRFANARAKAMLTLMLDGHRKDCSTCSKILEEANVGIFHGDEAKLQMDLEGFGPALPTSAPVVDLSQYPDSVAEMKKLLVEKDAKIKALEKRIQSLNADVKNDDIDKLDLVTMLDGVNEPTMDKYGGKFLKTAGYRIVDLRLLRMALEICQNCHHNKMTLAEMSPEIDGNQEDVVTRLAFVCTVCGPKAIFPTSPFSKTYPTNYSLNKLLLPLLGPSSYFHLAQFLQQNPDAPQEITTSGAFSHQKPQLLVSVDHAFFDFARPFDPPMPTDPDANLILTGAQPTQSDNSASSAGTLDPVTGQLKMRSMADMRAPPTSTMPALKPLEPDPLLMSNSADIVAISSSSKSNGSSNGSKSLPEPITRKIRACPELPPGCRITSVAPGTKLVSKHVKYSTTQQTGLAVGCYRVKEPDKDMERILIIRDEDKGGDGPVVVTELGHENRQVAVNKTSVSAPSKNNKSKKKARKNDTSSSEEEEVEEFSSDDDSDDPSWGSKRKKKNDGRGAGKKRKRNKY